MKIIDLSVSIQADTHSDPPGFTPQITYSNHAAGATQMASVFPGLTEDQLPRNEAGNEGWAIEFVNLCTHAGTHMDAPYHYRSRQDDGTPSMTIDEIPLDWCVGPDVKLDFRHFEDGYIVTPEDIDTELERTGHSLKEGDIVLVNTSAGKRYGFEDYLSKGCGMGRDATLHLTRQGIRVVGTDAWSWDAPFSKTVERFMKDADPSIIWEGHYAGSTIPYCHMEKLANLESLPATGFTVFCQPVKIHKASAGWVRPIAVIDE